MSKMHRILQMLSEAAHREDPGLTPEHLATLDAICTLFEKTEPEPGSSMALQIEATRTVVWKMRDAHARGHIASITNVEIVRLEALTRVTYTALTSEEGQKWLPQYAQFDLTPENVTSLWAAVSEIIRMYKRKGPYGYEGMN